MIFCICIHLHLYVYLYTIFFIAYLLCGIKSRVEEHLFRKQTVELVSGPWRRHKIFETDHVLAILDAFPITPGQGLTFGRCPVGAVPS